MANERFNRGEWKRSHRRRTFTKTHVVTITENDKWLAQVHGNTLIEAEATAALIAAAPAMYEALKRLVKRCEVYGAFADKDDYNGRSLEEARAALAAANPETVKTESNGK